MKCAADPTLEFIMEYVGPGKGPEAYRLWACRGEHKGCKRRVLKTKHHCLDCMETHDQQTLGEVYDRMQRGDA